jgi:hypothetical protein
MLQAFQLSVEDLQQTMAKSQLQNLALSNGKVTWSELSVEYLQHTVTKSNHGNLVLRICNTQWWSHTMAMSHHRNLALSNGKAPPLKLSAENLQHTMTKSQRKN